QIKERETAEAVLRPKLLGTLALRDAFGELELEAVVLGSSITAVAGGFGQIDYCAANNFLDAHARAGRGWNAAQVVSVNWGRWLEVGMAAETAVPAGFVALRRGERIKAIDHPVLNARHAGEGLDWCSGTLSPSTHWVLDEHRIGDVPVLPGTGHLELAKTAAEAVLPGDGVVELRDVVFVEPLSVADGATAEVRVVFSPEADGAEFQVQSIIGGSHRTHARGTAAKVSPPPAPRVDLRAIMDRCVPTADGQGSVPLSGLLTLGGHWSRTLTATHTGQQEALGLFEANDVLLEDLDRWGLHPALLDAATTFSWIEVEGHYLPLGYGRITVRGPLPEAFWSHLRVTSTDTDEVLVVDVTLVGPDGTVLVQVSDYVLRRIDADAVVTGVVASADAQRAAPSAGADDDSAGIRPADGAVSLRRLLAAPLGPQVVVAASTVAELLAGVGSLTQETVETELDPAAAAAKQDKGPAEGYVAPRNDAEATIARLWGEVLGGDHIGVDDDFFELGGNSLIAVQLIALIRKELGVRLPMRSLFEEPTVAGVAALVSAAATTATAPVQTIPRLPRSSS
ncbi:MAG: KR domain-containing protein, partial [Nonomuraea sp.]|nr:KR domain-containing protein [Nonomuraea sp.]